MNKNILIGRENFLLLFCLISQLRLSHVGNLCHFEGGVGGWLHRVYPEPWQIILQTPDDGDVLVAALDDRPTYLDALAMIQSAARDLKAKAK